MSDLGAEVRSLAELVDEVSRLNVLLQGTQANPGLIREVEMAVNTAAAVAERLNSAQVLGAQIQELPERLLSLVADEQFNRAIRETFTYQFISTLEQAQRQAKEQGIAVAGAEIRELVVEAVQAGRAEFDLLGLYARTNALLTEERVKTKGLLEETEALKRQLAESISIRTAAAAQLRQANEQAIESARRDANYYQERAQAESKRANRTTYGVFFAGAIAGLTLAPSSIELLEGLTARILVYL